MNAFPWMDAGLWIAIGGSLAVAVIADGLVLLALAARCWAMLMEQS
jgi:hypothetical protein